MAYATYITEAIVCGSFDRTGADRQFRLYTKTAGMLYATARSVREERSKQRPALQDFSLVNVTLVQGKGGWRIGSVEVVENLFLKADDRVSRTLVVGAVRLMNQFLQGEELHGEVFIECKAFLAYVGSDVEVSVDTALTLFEVRLLYLLGYVKVTTTLTDILASHTTYEYMLTSLSDDLQGEINEALVTGREVSHL